MTLVSTKKDLFPSFSSLFDDVLNTEFNDWRRQNFSAGNTTLPKVNIREDESGFVVEVAAPGLQKKDFKIELDNNLLTISSERKEEAQDARDQYTRKEFSYQAFQRAFTLPETADSEKVSAKYENGILNIAIPKKEEARPKPPKSIKIS